MNFLSGKKTYFTAIAIALIAGAKALGYEVPSWTFELLAAVGLTTVRDAIKKAEV